jgi:hypothetical protein
MATGRVPTTANSPLTAKGDLFGYSTAPARLAVGNDGEQIVADSSAATGLKWAKSVPFRGCAVFRSSVQTITNNVDTVLTWDSEHFDTDGFHSTSVNTNRITIPTGLQGYYRVTMMGLFDVNAVGYRIFKLFKNGTYWYNSPETPGSATIYAGPSVTFTLFCNAGDYLEMFAFQNSGSNINIFVRSQDNPFTVEYLGE